MRIKTLAYRAAYVTGLYFTLEESRICLYINQLSKKASIMVECLQLSVKLTAPALFTKDSSALWVMYCGPPISSVAVCRTSHGACSEHGRTVTSSQRGTALVT